LYAADYTKENDLTRSALSPAMPDHLSRLACRCNLHTSKLKMIDQTQRDPEIPSSIRVAYVGSIAIALPEEKVLTIIEWREPTPLPFAPEPVLGIVCIQGRMLTLLDTAKLLNIDSSTRKSIVALRGKEQLALTIDRALETFSVSPADIELPPESSPALIKRVIAYGHERLHLLALNKLFAAATQGHERRRRRY
jgi:chemotaxis signal transduction protein